MSIGRIRNNNISKKVFSSVKNIFKNFATIFPRFDISKMRSNELIIFVEIGKSKERLRTNTIKRANRLNKGENFNVRKPAVSQKDDMIVLISKKIIAKRNAFFN